MQKREAADPLYPQPPRKRTGAFIIIQGMLFEDVKPQAHERSLANVRDLDS